jgi:hypothetical protein
MCVQYQKRLDGIRWRERRSLWGWACMLICEHTADKLELGAWKHLCEGHGSSLGLDRVG